MKVLTLSIIASLLLLNCKKSMLIAETKPETGFNKQPAMLAEDNGSGIHFLYDQDKRLLVYSAADVINYYKPGSDHFLTQLHKESGEKIMFRNAQTDEGGRITKLDKYVQGILESNIELAYNEGGQLTSKKLFPANSDIVQEYIYSYGSNNLMKIEEYENDVLRATILFDYYDSKLNSTDLDLFDHKQIGFVTDKQFGNQSKNLVKSLKAVSADGSIVFDLQHLYKADSNDYVHSLQIKASNRILKKYNFIFQ